MIGTVTLVGAGPGDPGLLTLRGRQALREAQVVVYDRLVSPAILALIPADAERVDVGKEASHHPIPQEQINQILLEKALEGKNTVRLKGGDPFLFGRGGEELETLQAHGVPFREVPGISSAIAVPAYAGIPVTHRDFTSSLHIVTGHARKGKALDINFEALVRAGGTLVFLMGVTSLPDICAGLLRAGMDPDCPAAVIESGSTPRQRRLDATLSTLAQAAREQEISSPAISVFGRVCQLGEKLDWFDALPLKGKRIVVTRPRERAGVLSRRLRELGADVLECPCIETVSILPCPAMERALENIQDYQWLAFTSAAGVEAFAACLERRGWDARRLGGVRLAAIGLGTAGALKACGLRADLIPEVYDAAHLGAALAGAARGRVLLLRVEQGSPDLPAALTGAGVSFDDVACYRTRLTPDPQLRRLVEQQEGLLAAFTSASTVRGFCTAAGEGADFSRVTGVCIGPQTAAEAERYGIPAVTAPEATIDALIETIERLSPSAGTPCPKR
ncbi:MAG: uroporphyrinogen-III C-methyltransferase [Oscillospiraceae bacterium]|nr:uroporphyrinogen-III C-methyltransferase [Oscillospiraceae bacterium]